MKTKVKDAAGISVVEAGAYCFLLVFSCTLKAQFKDLMRECDELRFSRDEAVNCSKETEKKLKNMEAEAMRFQEVFT